MIVLKIVDSKNCYYFIKECDTVGIAYKYLTNPKFVHSTHIWCTGMFDTCDSTIPPHLYEVFKRQLPPIDKLIEYDSYPLYLTLKGDKQ